MKFYVASRTARTKEVKEIIETILSKGHEITHDWTGVENATLERPYHKHKEVVREFALKDVEGAKNAEVFIILGDNSGTGMYVELGAALASNARVYAVGEYNDATVFHFHPQVTRVGTIDEAFNDLKI